MGSIGTSDPNTLDTSSGSVQPAGAVTLLSEWGVDIVCMLWSLWFEFGVSLKGEMFEKDPEFACIDIRCQVNFPPAQREVT